MRILTDSKNRVYIQIYKYIEGKDGKMRKGPSRGITLIDTTIEEVHKFIVDAIRKEAEG